MFNRNGEGLLPALACWPDPWSPMSIPSARAVLSHGQGWPLQGVPVSDVCMWGIYSPKVNELDGPSSENSSFVKAGGWGCPVLAQKDKLVSCMFVIIPVKTVAIPADQRPVKRAQDCGGGVCPAGCPYMICGWGVGFSLGGHSALSITPYSSNLWVWWINEFHLLCGFCSVKISHQFEPFYFRSQNRGKEHTNSVLTPGCVGSTICYQWGMPKFG